MYKEGFYYVLEFLENRDIMTKELSQICLFFVMFCLNIFSAWDILYHVNPILFFKQGMFCLGMFCTGIFYSLKFKIGKYKGEKIQGKVVPGLF